MKKRTNLALLGMLACLACSPRPEPEVVVVEENKVPGTIEGMWVEPMYDTIDVPAQIDPKGVYYRPAHKEVVEIRSDRFEKVRFNGEKKDRK